MRHWITATCFATLMAVPVAAQDLEIGGAYTVQGRNADGSGYAGDLTIRQSGPTVQANWQIGADGFNAAGTLEGRVLTLFWQAGDPVVYVVMEDGELHGTWADGLALEKATPVR